MSKTLMDKKVNKEARRLNRTLEQDVFKDRFSVRQFQKSKADGIEYYLYQLIDKECPERNKVIPKWFSCFEITKFNSLWIEMNDFIITSDFWDKHRKVAK